MNSIALARRLRGWTEWRRKCPIVVCSAALAGLSLTAVASPPGAALEQLRAPDLAGRWVRPFAASRAKATVFLFMSVDCPISNSYFPELIRLRSKFSAEGVEFEMVFPNPDESPAEVRQHQKEYRWLGETLRDPEHALTRAVHAEVTPEAAVFAPGKGFVYRGRIDNRYVDFGKARPAATEHDLSDALTALLSGRRIARPITRAVGCYISDAP